MQQVSTVHVNMPENYHAACARTSDLLNVCGDSASLSSVRVRFGRSEMESQAVIKLLERIATDRKHANDVVQLLELMEEPNNKIVVSVCEGLSHFFIKTFAEKRTTRGESKCQDTQLFFTWASDRFHEFFNKLIELMNNESEDLQNLGLLTCISLIEKEMMIMSSSQATHIPERLISALLSGIISCHNFTALESNVHQVLRLLDLRYHIVKLLPKCMADCLRKCPKEQVFTNVFSILEIVSKITSTERGVDSPKLYLSQGNLKDVSSNYNDEFVQELHMPALDAKEYKKMFSITWLEFLRFDLDRHTTKLILCLMQKHIIPNFASPCVLADFLTHCFKQGGGIALLSLHGLFVLMTEHNLEYPKFYKHLYGMIHPRIFDAKYQSRFFNLLDIFLSSSHLPAYLVAAFAKKLSRLALVSPTYALPLLVNFTMTLIDRHPTIKVLINRPKSNQSQEFLLQGDPYLASQEDPAMCKALESSLWELTTLKNHFLPNVSYCVKDLSKAPQQDIHSLLDNTYLDMFESTTGKDFKEAPMNYVKPVSLFGGFEDVTAELWTV